MSVKLLSFLNVSNRESIGCDSGVIFHSLLFPECVRQGYEVVIAAPCDIAVEGTRHVFYEPGKSKYDVRFRFDWEAYEELIKEVRPDVIFCHQVEQCASMRALLVTMGLSKRVKLLTYYHYIPAMEMQGQSVIWDPSLNHENLGEVIFLRILGALNAADVFFVTSAYSRWFLAVLAQRYNFEYDDKKVVVMPPPADPFFEVDQPARFAKGRNTVLYSARLYEQYGSAFLLDIIEHYRGSPVKFVITDFFFKKSAERKRLDPKTEQCHEHFRHHENVILRHDGDDRRTYRDDIVTQASMVFGPYRRNATWCMGMIDAFMTGVPGIAPNVASFPEFMPPMLLYHDQQSAIRLIDRLLSDKRFWTKASNKCRESYHAFMPEKVLKIFCNALDHI